MKKLSAVQTGLTADSFLYVSSKKNFTNGEAVKKAKGSLPTAYCFLPPYILLLPAAAGLGGALFTTAGLLKVTGTVTLALSNIITRLLLLSK